MTYAGAGSIGGNPIGVIRRLVFDCRGATAAEYAVLLALFGGTIALAALALGEAIGCSVDRSALTILEQKALKNNQHGHSNPRGEANGHQPNC